MGGVNRVTLMGNLGTDPEARRSARQVAVCRFRLATSERRKDAEGNWAEHTEWHNVVAFGKTAESCAAHLRKGSQVYVEGRLRTRAWQDEEGQARHATEVMADDIQFVGGRPTARAPDEAGPPPEAVGERDESDTGSSFDDDIPP